MKFIGFIWMLLVVRRLERLTAYAIRSRLRYNDLRDDDGGHTLRVLRCLVEILQKEGTPHVIIPFDVQEPLVSGRRWTAQFQKLIAASAYLYQMQRPILTVNGKRYVIAIGKDLEVALDVATASSIINRFKIIPSGEKILQILPTKKPEIQDEHMTVEKIHSITKIPESTVKYFLKDLYQAGLCNRQEERPYSYWIDEEIAKALLAKGNSGVTIDYKTKLAKGIPQNR